MENVADFYRKFNYPAMGKNGIYAYVKMKRNLFQRLGMRLDYFKGKDILEAGCGTGESTLVYHYFNAKSVTGVDISDTSIVMARQTASELELKTNFLVMDVQNLTPLNMKYDFIMCEVIHQTLDPKETLKSIVRMLKDDGRIVISVASFWGNLMDNLKSRLVSLLAGGNLEKRLKIAKALFFNKFLMWTKCRGVKKREFINLEQVIADIYLHPYRKNVSASHLLKWLDGAGLEYISSFPSIGFGSKKPNILSCFVGHIKLFFGGEYHLAVLAKHNDKRTRTH